MRPARPFNLYTVAALSLGVSAASAIAGETYDCTVNSPASSLNFSVTGSAPLGGSFRGNATIAPPALQTRTKTPPASFFSCGIIAGENDDVGFTGTGALSGSATALRPTGAFRIAFDTVAGTSSLISGSFDLLGTSTVNAASTINNFSSSPFCAVNPGCQVPISLTFNFPLGDAQITDLLADQTGGPAIGTLTPTGPNSWDYSIPAVFNITPAVLFGGAPLPTAPTPVPAVVTGTITRSGPNIAVTTVLTVNLNQSNLTPTPLPESPVTLAGAPICNGMNLLLTATVNSSTLAFTTNSSIVSVGTPVLCPCDADLSGELGADDIFAFLDAWFIQNGLSGPNLSADFDASGTVTADDIFAFLDCWFAAPSNLGC